MLALMLFTSRFHVDVVNATYERSRWALFVSMIISVTLCATDGMRFSC